MQIQVTKTKVILPENYTVNKGEYHVNVLEFSFSEEYTDDLVKKAIFVSGELAIEQAIINNTCHIPNEVLNVKSFELRVYAYEVENGELILRYSPTYATIYLREGSYRGNTGSGEVITPTQFEQYEQALNEGLQEIEEGLEGAENVDIDANKSGAVATITITDRNGTEKTVQIYDGEDVGTDDYIDLNNKPSINNVTLIGNKTSSDLGLQPEGNYIVDNNYVHTDNNYTSAEKTKLAGIEDNAEVNIIESIVVNGVTATISNKTASVTVSTGGNSLIDSISVNGVAQTITNKNVDITVPTNNNQLTNGAGYQTASDVQTAINNQIGSTYKAKGSIAFASLPALSSSVEGFVYNVTDSFTTTSDFVEGAGKAYPAGTNVVIINTTGNTYKYDVLAGFVDLSNYVLASDLVAYTNSEIDAIFA